jgi:hypothetical protein
LKVLVVYIQVATISGEAPAGPARECADNRVNFDALGMLQQLGVFLELQP